MNLKKYFLPVVAALLLALFILLSVVYLRYRSWSAAHGPAEKLVTYLAQITKSDFQYKKLEWHLLPYPSVRFSQPAFFFKSGLQHQLKAESLQLRLSLSKLLVGEVGFSGLRLRQGEWRGQIELPKGVHDFLVEHIDLKTGPLLSDRPVKLYMSGDSGGRRKAVVIHGELRLPPFEAPSLDRLGFKVQILTRNFRLEGTPEWEFMGWIPSSGTSDFLIELEKNSDANYISFSGDAGIHELTLRAPGSAAGSSHHAGNVQLKFAGQFNPSTDEFRLTDCSTELPFAKLNLQGAYLPHRREFRGMSFNLTGIKLDDLPKYIPDIKSRIPFFIGFSGQSDFSISLSGFPSRLKIYSDFDLTHALFTYGKFFQKPKGKPLRIKADMNWAEGLLSGEFAGSFESLTFKGNLPEWRSSGEMKLNVITNAFAAEQLTGYVPFLTNYDFSGNMKLFASFQGKFQGDEPFERMFHVNFQKGRILRQGTQLGIHDIDLDFDFGPMIMESKEFRFTLGGTAFKGTFKGMHPEKNPQWEGQIESGKMIPAAVWKEGMTLWSGTDAAAQQSWARERNPLIQKIISSEDSIESAAVRFSSVNQNFKIESLTMNAFGGALAGTADFPAGKGELIKIQLTGSDMDSARVFKFMGTPEPSMEGLLNWKADVQAKFLADGSRMDLSGPVSFSIRNGVLARFNFVQALEQMELLKKADQEPGDRTPFDSLDVTARLDDNDLKLDQVSLKNSEIQINGQGEISADGILNLRMKTQLEAGYFRRLFPKRAGNFIAEGDAFFGPVTLLASGYLDALSLKPDPQSVAELAGRLARKKTKIISKFF